MQAYFENWCHFEKQHVHHVKILFFGSLLEDASADHFEI